MASDPGPSSPPRWRVWLAAARPRTLPAAVAPVAVGSAFAWRDGGFAGLAAAECLVFALLIQVGTNFANDYYDFRRGADTERRVGPVRAVASGLVAPRVMRTAMRAVFAAAFVVGLGLLGRGGPWLLAVGLASIFCGIAYTGGPFPLGYHGLGDVFVFLFFGLVAVSATYFVQAGRLTGEVVGAAVPVGLLAANILVANNYRDAENDALAGKRTLVVRFGRRFARIQYEVSLGIALAVPIVAWARGGTAWRLLPVVLAPFAASLARRLRTAGSAPELIRLLGDSGKFLALYAALFAAGVVL